MTKLITSDVDRYLAICKMLDEESTYIDMIEELHISRSVIPKVKKHRKEHPEFEVAERKKIADKKKAAKKVSTKPVPRSTEIVPISTNLVLRSTLLKQVLIDEFKMIETYFRKGIRPSQVKAITMFKKHLGEL